MADRETSSRAMLFQSRHGWLGFGVMGRNERGTAFRTATVGGTAALDLQSRAQSRPITVQYIVYGDLENKTNKLEWRDNTRNPKGLLEDIMDKAVELTYSYEMPNGLFRKTVRYYNENLIRVLLVNSLAHSSRTISNDITIKVYLGYICISNPGGLPLGVTKDNILHTKHRRNPSMIEILTALGLMEGEDSGFDLIYELDAVEAKKQPEIESTFNTVTV